MWQYVVLSWLAVAAGDVEVVPLTGPPVVGRLVDLATDKLVVSTSSGPVTLDPRSLQQARWKGADGQDASGEVTVELLDGSKLVAESFTTKAGKAALRLPGGVPVTVRARAVRSVRLRRPQPSVDAQWKSQLDDRPQADLLIIRKSTKGANENEPSIVLDRQAGVIQEVTESVVQFELDGERIPVKREKLEGLVFYQSEERDLPDPWCRADDATGSFWVVKTLRLKGEDCELETVGGATATVPLARLRRLDFSVGNTVYLSDLEPDSVEWIPYFESRAAADNLARLNQPRRDRGFDGGRLLLGNQSYEKGLAVRSRTTLVYRVPRQFKRLVATAGIDDHVRENGHVRLVIQGDSKVLLDTTITGRDRPRELEVDLGAARRLTILVDFGEELDVADYLNLCNARFTK